MQRTINRNTQLQQKAHNHHASKYWVMIGSCLLLSLSACSTLPRQENIKPEYAYDIETKDTPLAQIISPLKAQNPELTGYHVLYDPLEAI